MGKKKQLGKFVAIDFETADYQPDSACALGMIRVEEGKIVDRTYILLRPPRSYFQFTYIHGITWTDVKDEPTFAELWPHLQPKFADVDFIAAHNANFDRSVLNACCQRAGLAPLALPYLCTVQLARTVWNIRPTKLPNVCEFLNIPLDHHQALSDAEACAQIVIAAQQTACISQTAEEV
ncbi:MAG: 3'-5' exonuclease [Acaryochloridaceae cyanobacterium CSU_3_4]|nr:3'-5' exonuclease [Acaryochloridaceae cyanobacterium CSU_3_4]